MEEKAKSPPIFVFGSNLAGRHGKGAALCAKKHHGAIYGQGEGLQGSSYAIPTKDEGLKPLPLERIKEHVDKFKDFAKSHPELRFRITAIGCGLAGHSPGEIGPMFADAPENCELPEEFKDQQGPPKDDLFERLQDLDYALDYLIAARREGREVFAVAAQDVAEALREA